MLLAVKLKVNQTELMNRIVLPPMASEKAMGGYVTDALCDFYKNIVEDRATGSRVIIMTTANSDDGYRFSRLSTKRLNLKHLEINK